MSFTKPPFTSWATSSHPLEFKWTPKRLMRCEAGHDLPRSRSYRGSLDLQTFIVGSSLITARWRHLSLTTETKDPSISWAPEAEQAFHQLKSAFCTAPALIHPDPSLRFVVEVDAATLGVGAALSQWKGEPPAPSLLILLPKIVPGGAEL